MPKQMNTQDSQRLEAFLQGLQVLQDTHGVDIDVEILPPQLLKDSNGGAVLQATAKIACVLRPGWNGKASDESPTVPTKTFTRPDRRRSPSVEPGSE